MNAKKKRKEEKIKNFGHAYCTYAGSEVGQTISTVYSLLVLLSQPSH